MGVGLAQRCGGAEIIVSGNGGSVVGRDVVSGGGIWQGRETSMKIYDAIVLGLGGMGSAAAFHLARRRRRVLGIEQFTSPHDRGSSHGATRVIRQAYFEHPGYVPLLKRAYELWAELEGRSGRRLVQLPGGLMMGPRDSAVVAGSLRSAREHGLPHEMLDAEALRRRYPQFRVSDDTLALFEGTAGLVWSEAAIQAHLDAAVAEGAELRFEEPVVRWEAEGGGAGVVVETGCGVYHAEQLVITPGPWAPQVLASWGLPLEVTRQVLFWLQPPGGVGAYLPERFPIYIWQRNEAEEIYGFPAVDGPEGGVKVAFFHEPGHEVVTPETVDRSIRRVDEEWLRAAVREFLPGLDGAVVRAKVCLYTTTPDRHFIVSRHPHHSQVSVACGFSGHGYKFCSVMGEILADLAMGRRPEFDLGLFDPGRFDR